VSDFENPTQAEIDRWVAEKRFVEPIEWAEHLRLAFLPETLEGNLERLVARRSNRLRYDAAARRWYERYEEEGGWVCNEEDDDEFSHDFPGEHAVLMTIRDLRNEAWILHRTARERGVADTADDELPWPDWRWHEEWVRCSENYWHIRQLLRLAKQDPRFAWKDGGPEFGLAPDRDE
jgi:hypothetical protein